jgi:RHS repeat-associated protein
LSLIRNANFIDFSPPILFHQNVPRKTSAVVFLRDIFQTNPDKPLMKRRSHALVALLFSASFLLVSFQARATAEATSQLSYNGLFISPSGGIVSLTSNWQASAYAQAGVNSQYNTGGSPFATAAGDFSIATGSASVPGLPSINVFGGAVASNSIFGQLDASDQATARSTVWNDGFMITGGSGSVNTTFSINISGLLNLFTDTYGQSADAETVFTLQLNGNPVLFNDSLLSIGPNQSQALPISTTLSDSITLQYNTTYQLLIEADTESSVLNVPEPGIGALAILFAAIAFVFWRKRARSQFFSVNLNLKRGVTVSPLNPECHISRTSWRTGRSLARNTVLFSAGVAMLLIATGARAMYIGGDPPLLCEKCGVPANRQSVGSTFLSLTEGNLREDYPVVSFQSGGPSLQMSLTYNSYNADGSRAQVDCGLGLGWTHSYNLFLFSQRGSFFLMGPDGRVTLFHETAPGSYATDSGYFETLTPLGGSMYAITNKEQSWWIFNSVPNTPFLVAGPVFRLIQMGDRNNNVTSLTYNNGLLTQISDPYGRTLTLGYTNKHLATITDPLGHVTMMQYDPKNRTPIRITDPLGNSVRYTYNSLYQITHKTDKDGRNYLFLYRNKLPFAIADSLGQAWFAESNPTNWSVDRNQLAFTLRRIFNPSTTTNIDGNGNTWRYQYDANGSVTGILYPDGNTSTYSYDPSTRLMISQTDPNGNTTSYRYDAEGNRTNSTDALGNVTTYTYEPNFNQLTGITDPNGHTTSYQYDSHGNKTNEIDPLGKTLRFTYDTHGNLTSETDKNGNTTTFGYDTFGDRTNLTDSLGRTTSYGYDAIGNHVSTTDPLGHSTRFQYDAQNEVIGVTNALGGVYKYTYDQDGRQLSVTDPNTNTTTSVYDNRGRLIREIDPLGRTTRYGYDADDNKTEVTNALGRVTTYAYDTRNREISVLDAAGRTTYSTYDPAGNLLSTTDPNTNTTFYAYDALNRRVAETNALGGVTIYDYATPSGPPCCSPTIGSSLVTEIIDPLGHVTYFHYDADDRQVQANRKNSDTNDVVNPGDSVTTTFYDDDGNVIETIEPAGRATYTYYDADGEVTNHVDGAGQMTITYYDDDGNVTAVTDPNTNTTFHMYDALDRETNSVDPAGRVSTTYYDADGEVIETIDGNGKATMTFYDADGEVTETIDPLGRTSMTFYDADGEITETVDEAGHQTFETYDALGREIAETNAVGVVTQTFYDSDGNVTSVVDGDGHATEYTYDALGRRTSEVYLDAVMAVTYSYDADGNVISQTDQNGRVTTYSYNALNYETNEVDSFASVSNVMTYDSAGRIVAAQRGGWVETYAYDGDDRVTNSTQNGYVVQYTYDEVNRDRTITYPSGLTITETLDGRDRLIKVHDGTANPPITTYTYDADDRVVQRTSRNGTVTTYTYDADGHPTNIDHTIGVSHIITCTYAYDADGHKLYELKQDNPSDSETYQYDAIERLTNFDVGLLSGGVILSPALQEGWLFDSANNWLSITSNGVPQLRAYDLDNELTNISGSTLFYDSDGNLVMDTAYAYSYDEDHHLTQVQRLSDSAIVGRYFYDALGRRIEKITDPAGVASTNMYIYDGDRIIEERDGAGNLLATYVYGNYIDEVVQMNRGVQSYYYHQNALWSPLALTDSGGNVVERYTYDVYGSALILDSTYSQLPRNAWGTVHSAVGNAWLFTGRQLDEETGLYNYRARFYDSVKGRFLQRDSAGHNDSMNLYEYANSSPATFLDPFGHSVVIDCDKVEENDKTYDNILDSIEGELRARLTLNKLISAKKEYRFGKPDGVKDYLKLNEAMAHTDNALQEARRSRNAWDETTEYLKSEEAKIAKLRKEGKSKLADQLEEKYKKDPRYVAPKGQTAMYHSKIASAQNVEKERKILRALIKLLEKNTANDQPVKDLLKKAKELLKESEGFSSAAPGNPGVNPIAHEPSTTPEGFGATGGGEGFAAASPAVHGD